MNQRVNMQWRMARRFGAALVWMGGAWPAAAQPTGDTCQTAIELGGPLPLTVNGTTLGFAHDYDEACPYGGSDAPDVVYRFVPDVDMLVDVLLCRGPTDYDAKLYIYDSCSPGAALACSDDACFTPAGQGYVPALWNVLLAAGQSYYIVIDGYDGAAGNFTLDLSYSLPPPVCPDTGLAVFSQVPDLAAWQAAFSDRGWPYWDAPVRWENFCAVDQRITGLRFWGLKFDYDYLAGHWQSCSDVPLEFEIEFFADAGGQPGAWVNTYYLTVEAVTPVGTVGYALYDLYEFDVDLPTPCVLRDGWISIQGAGAPECWFVWMPAGGGDGRSWGQHGGWYGDVGFFPFDLAFCLLTDGVPTFGSCCDDETGECQENVQFAHCTGRFQDNGACADFDPPCGGATGACCDAWGGCTLTTRAQCLGSAICRGDMNCDGVVDEADVDPFVLALSDVQAYQQAFPQCRWENADCNEDGYVAFDDIAPFLARIGAECGLSWLGANTVCGACAPARITCPSDLPYTVGGTTCGRRNDITYTCLGAFDDGPEVVYELVVAGAPLGVEIALNPFTAQHSAIVLDDEFPPLGDCLAASINAAAQPHGLGCQWLEPGTYYLTVDSWPGLTTPCLEYFELSVTPCDPTLGRCCFGNPLACADLPARACDALGGSWDGALTCNSPCPTMAREDCPRAEWVANLPFTASFDNSGMSADGPGAPCDKYGAAERMQNDAWFAWTAPAAGLVTARVSAVDYDAVLSVWNACGSGAPHACRDHDTLVGGVSVETLSFPTTAGALWYFQMGKAGHHPGGAVLTFELDCATGSGACCLPDGACTPASGTACFDQGGTYQGDGTDCGSANCAAPSPGDDCADPVAVTLSAAALPFVDQNSTRGRTDNYHHTCLATYDRGPDVVYELAVTEPLVVRITLDPHGTRYTGFALARTCPPDGECQFSRRSTDGGPYAVDYVVLLPGVYYLLVDSWLSPDGIPLFDLLVETCDTQTGACCVNGVCVAEQTLAQCLAAGGAWKRAQPCDAETCEPVPGDSCARPIVVPLPNPYSYYDDASTQDHANDYCGTTCLGLDDGGRDRVYRLEVSAPVVLDLSVSSYSSLRPPLLVLSDVCPPAGNCLVVDWIARGVALSPGVYYLMADIRPRLVNGVWVDYSEFRVQITSRTGPPTPRPFRTNPE